ASSRSGSNTPEGPSPRLRGEGAPKGRMRGAILQTSPLTRRFAPPSPRERGEGSGGERMAVVETRQLTKVFKRGNVGAVNNVDLQSREGEFLVLLGPSGSGKTTLLRMIAGL